MPLVLVFLLIFWQVSALAQDKIFNESVLIDKKFKNSKGLISQFQIAIALPKNSDTIILDALVDKLDPKYIDKINWCFDPKNPSSKRIEAKEILEQINYAEEKLDKNLVIAYERISENKRIVIKRFIFDRINIINKETLSKDFFLELNFADGSKALINISDDLTKTPVSILPSYIPRLMTREEAEEDSPIFQEEGRLESAQAEGYILDDNL